MTNANNNNEDIRDIVANLARMQTASQFELDMLIDNTNRVLGFSSAIESIVSEVRENTEQLQRNFEQHQQNYEETQENILRILENQERNFAQHQRNFVEHQRTTNAALNSLEAINLRLIQIITDRQN